MSQVQNPGLDSGGTGPGRSGVRGRRAASVTLREGEQRAQSVGDLMDPANKSLADALKIAYRLLQVLILVLVVVFIFSSTREVQTSEIGVRTTFGKIDRDDLEPGLHLSWPDPFGKIIKITRTEQRADLTREFFPGLSDAEEKQMTEKGKESLADGGRDSLDPDTDGALLTADGSLVHTRWQITYQRTKNSKSLRAFSSDADSDSTDYTEKRIVNAVSRRAIVQAAAKMSIDEVLSSLKDPGRIGAFEPLNIAAKRIAQEQLARMDAGITLQNFDMKTPMAPRQVMKTFGLVQTSQSLAKQQREQAEGEAKNTLLKAAGAGAPIILDLIDQYERDLATADAPKAAATLEKIHIYMRRKPIEIDGKPVAAVVSGQVASIVAQAEQYRTGTVTRASGDAASFAAKLLAFKANPQVFLTGEWTDALGSVLSRDTVQTMMLPPGLERLMVQINRDPWLAQEMKQKLDALKVEENQKNINKNRRRELFEKKFDATSLEGV